MSIMDDENDISSKKYSEVDEVKLSSLTTDQPLSDEQNDSVGLKMHYKLQGSRDQQDWTLEEIFLNDDSCALLFPLHHFEGKRKQLKDD